MAQKYAVTVRKLAYSALCLALCLVLPFVTGQVPQVGSMLCPMHLPVLLAGFLCGPWWALAVGFIAPLLRNLLFGMPPIVTAIAMSFELATYGLVCGILYNMLRKNVLNVYISLVAAMIAGRVVWGIVMLIISGATNSVFGWGVFVSGAVLNALPGIALQIILIPVIVMALRKAKIIK